ncbi:MAG: hypothetical protein CFE26_12930 [Verrucomicrobiales bacterium VVV1]|nr:MAG: hypothetical protein CFE26_12930 [Verrucomicrobiales bacterium VVV1]
MESMPGVRCLFRILIHCLVMLCCLGVAMGHVGFENTTEIRIQPERMRVVVRMAVALTWLLKVTAGGEVLPLQMSEAGFNDEGAAEFTLDYDRPAKGPVRVEALFFKVMGPLDSGTISVFDESLRPASEGDEPMKGKVIVSADPALDFHLPGDAVLGVCGGNIMPEPPGLGRYFLLGIEHILTGYDHLLFLFALVVACRGVRPMLIIVTAFTLAHSITLALAAMKIVTLPSQWVESFIALSIIFVGVENVFLKVEPKRRAVLTFAFGLVHGLGFANVLRDIGLGSNGHSIFGPLISFNLGVETGQLALVAIVLPILIKLRKRPRFEKYAVPVMSVAVILMGSVWLFERVRGGL